MIEISHSISEELIVRAELPNKETEQQTLTTRLTELKAQVQTLTKPAGVTAAARLAEVTAALADRDQAAQQVGRRLGELEALQSEVDLARTTRFPAYTANLRSKHPNAGLTDAEWALFKVDFRADVGSALTTKIAESRAASDAIAGNPDNVLPNLDGLTKEQLMTQTLAALRGATKTRAPGRA